MKKGFKYFGIVWAVLLVVFNLITFVIPAEIAGVNRFESTSFWIAYGFIMASLIAFLIITYVFCKKDIGEELLFNIPLLKVGYGLVIVSVIVGLVFMIVPVIPWWLCVIVCCLLVAIYAIKGAKSMAVKEAVVDVGEKVKAKTVFMKMAVVDAENIMVRATTDEIKAEIKKVYEALKYSDYTSCPELAKIEVHIEDHIEQLKNGVDKKDLEMVKTETNELLLLIKEREIKCKALK